MYRYLFVAEAVLENPDSDETLHECKDLEVKFTSDRVLSINSDIDAELASGMLKQEYIRLLGRFGIVFDEDSMEITLTSYGIEQIDKEDTYVFKYLFHGSVGVINPDTLETYRDYEDFQTEYESRRPLNIQDGPDFALCAVILRQEYVSRLIKERFEPFLTGVGEVDVLSCGFTEIPEHVPPEVLTTSHGAKIMHFQDAQNEMCSVQESSAGSEPRLWLGINKVEAKHLVPGQGWKVYHLPDHFMLNGRMELNKRQVQDLIPHLTQFVNTGGL